LTGFQEPASCALAPLLLKRTNMMLITLDNYRANDRDSASSNLVTVCWHRLAPEGQAILINEIQPAYFERG
jgi:hypothetical protein